MINNTSIQFDQPESERVDQFLARKYPEYSRSYFQGLIISGEVLVNNIIIKPSFKLKNGDRVNITFSEIPVGEDLVPADIPLNIIFENDDVIVINKQPGIVVHPAAGNPGDTLVNALIHHFPGIKRVVYDEDSEVSKIRPGLVHRLDKDTSGIIIVAKNARAMHSLSRQIQNRTVIKKYWALCYGWPKSERGILTNFLGRHPKNRKLIAEVGDVNGKKAISDYLLKKNYEFNGCKVSLIEFDIKTGRTHQIRVQAKIMGCPVIGDRTYGTKESIELSDIISAKRQMLHAKELRITLPGDDKPSIFKAPPPADFEKVLNKITSS